MSLTLMSVGGGKLSKAASGVSPTIVKNIANFTGADSGVIQLIFSGNVTSGNLLVVCAFGRNTGTDVVYTADMLEYYDGTAAMTTPFTLDANTANNNPGSSSIPSAIWSTNVTGTGTCELRISLATWGGGTTRTWAQAFEVGLVNVTGSRVNAFSNVTVDNSTAVTSAAIATGGAGIIFGVFGAEESGTTTVTEDVAFTLGTEVNGVSAMGSIIYQPTNANITDAASWTTSANVYSAICAVAYKAATP